MKNRDREPLDLISDVILSILIFKRLYNDFNGFSSSAASLEDNKSTEIDSEYHIQLCIDKTPSKVRFVSKNDVVCPLKLDSKSLKIELGTAMRSPWGTFRATASF